MAIATTIDLIQDINRTITGVTKAPALTAYPLKADRADLPLCLTVPAEGTFHHEGVGGGLRRQDRIYRIIVFVEPVAQSEFPINARNAAILLQRFIETWLTVSLSNGGAIALADPPPFQVTVQASIDNPHSDSGIRGDLSIGGNAYHGFTIDLRVREIW